MKCSIMLHLIWVFTVCQSTSLGGFHYTSLSRDAFLYVQLATEDTAKVLFQDFISQNATRPKTTILSNETAGLRNGYLIFQ